MSDTPYYRHYTREEFEVQYNARLQVPDNASYVAQNEMLSAEYRAIGNVEADIAFGDAPLQKLDLFMPQDPAGAPVHLFIHGGYWRSRTKESFSFMAKPLVERGAIVAVTSYTLCPDVRIEDIVAEMRAAVLWLHRNVGARGGDPDAIHVSGHSAGGHLAAMLLATDWSKEDNSLKRSLIKSCVPISGLFELAPMCLHSVNEELRLDDDQVARVSPARMKPDADVPMSVFVGGDESELFQEQSTAFHENWKSSLTASDVQILPEHNHYTILSDLRDPEFVITARLIELMGLADSAT